MKETTMAADPACPVVGTSRPFRCASRPRAALALATAVHLLAACASIDGDWESAKTADTPEAYAEFVKKHPSSAYSAEASERRRELRDWHRAINSDSVRSYERYLSTHEDGRNAPEARRRIEAKEREVAERKEKALQARKEKARRDWERAVATGSASAFEAFLEHHPRSPNSNDARMRLASLRSEQEQNLLSRLQKSIDKAEILSSLAVKRGFFAKNIVVRSRSSMLQYMGNSVDSPGDAFARIPSEGDVWQPISVADFAILRIADLPEELDAPTRFDDVVGHSGGSSFPVGYVMHWSQGLVLIVPREAIPCELEFRGPLYGRVTIRNH